MTTFWYIVAIAIGSVLLYTFVRAYRRQSECLHRPELQVPIIPTQLTVEPEPLKLFLDPLMMQLVGDQTETVLLVTLTGEKNYVLVNSSSAKIFREQGWEPFRQRARFWADSPAAYCWSGPQSVEPPEQLGELSLPYLHSQLFGDGPFGQAFKRLNDFWLEHAEEYGYEKPRLLIPFDFSRPGC
ncbi:MAG: hypothetical protein V1738_01415 [Patescibacteria group bacterium]